MRVHSKDDVGRHIVFKRRVLRESQSLNDFRLMFKVGSGRQKTIVVKYCVIISSLWPKVQYIFKMLSCKPS